MVGADLPDRADNLPALTGGRSVSLKTFGPDSWYPVRLPAVDSQDTVQQWCASHCEAAWFHASSNEEVVVYWFESNADAMAFSLQWFPFRAL